MMGRPDPRKPHSFEPPYDRILEGILCFKSFAEAEESLGRIEALRKQFAAAGDVKGTGYCRRVALLGRRRAEFIGRNGKVGLQKRLEKQEIAFWFQNWLENPELFDDWLVMRKQAPSFRTLCKAAE